LKGIFAYVNQKSFEGQFYDFLFHTISIMKPVKNYLKEMQVTSPLGSGFTRRIDGNVSRTSVLNANWRIVSCD